jgi:hypothetical protein
VCERELALVNALFGPRFRLSVGTFVPHGKGGILSLNQDSFAASKLWNAGRWTLSRVWDAIGHVPDVDELCSYLKTHDRYGDVNP